MTRTLRAALITLGDPGQLTGGYLFHRRLAELAPTYAAELSFVSFPERPFPWAIRDAPRVLAEINQIGPDVVVLDSIAAAFMAFAAPRQPMLGMLHQPPGGIDFGPLRSAFQAQLDRLAYRHLRRILAASESLAEDLRREGVPADRLAVVPPGRDVAPAPADPLPELRRGRRVAFLSVGNWMERKGILTLLDAFAYVDEPLATLHLVGRTAVEPAYARRIWARIAQPELRSRVVVHGPVSTSEVAALYAAADAFVLPSLKEPFGTVYGEAMAFGLPVVGWRAGNLPYLAENGREGLVVATHDVPGLTHALRRLAENDTLRNRLGRAARERALTRPTWDEVAALFFAQLRAASTSNVMPDR